MDLPRETGPGPLLSWRQVVKERPSGENALGAPYSLREHLLTLRAPRRAKEYIADGVMHPFLILNSLRNPRKDAAESAAFRIRTSTGWLRRHENGSSAPRGAVLSRRRHWFVSFYSHSSTVFQARRETLGVYFCNLGRQIFGRDNPQEAVPTLTQLEVLRDPSAFAWRCRWTGLSPATSCSCRWLAASDRISCRLRRGCYRRSRSRDSSSR